MKKVSLIKVLLWLLASIAKKIRFQKNCCHRWWNNLEIWVESLTSYHFIVHPVLYHQHISFHLVTSQPLLVQLLTATVKTLILIGYLFQMIDFHWILRKIPFIIKGAKWNKKNILQKWFIYLMPLHTKTAIFLVIPPCALLCNV